MNPIATPHQISRNGERGSVLALTAICMLALILALGLCLDISHFYSVQTEMQNAADASALAGASALNSTAAGLDLAETLAVAAMNQYEFNHSATSFSSNNLYFATDFNSLQTFIYPNSTTTCAAIAALSTPSNVERYGETKLNPTEVAYVGVCMPAPANSPIFFSSSAITGAVLIRGRAIAGNSPPLTGVCDALAPVSLLDDPAVPNSTEYSPGDVIVLRNDPGGAYAAGHYGLTEQCGPGGASVRDALQGNCAGCLSVGDVVHPKSGVTAGPVRQGWNDRFDADLVTSRPITYSTYQQQYKDYIATGTTPAGATINASGTYGRRVILVPAINKNDVASNDWHVTDFMAFFMQDQVPGGNGGEVTAEFISKISIAKGTYGGPTPISSLTQIVLYK